MRGMSGPDFKRLAPFSIRFTPEERARLDSEAGSVPLGQHIKERLFSSEATNVCSDNPERPPLAQILAKLGASDIAFDIREACRLVKLGALEITPETEARLVQAADDIAEIYEGAWDQGALSDDPESLPARRRETAWTSSASN